MPDLEAVINQQGISGLPAALLRAVWAGRGHPVSTERVFDALFADDPNGGPSPTGMYAVARRAHYDLSAALEGSGVAVSWRGRRQGWRLRLTPAP